MSHLPALSFGLALLLPPPGPVMVAVPEAKGAGRESLWIGEAIAEMLPRALTEAGVAAVERSERLRAQEALEIAPVALTRATSIRLAEVLGSPRLVTGVFELEGTLLHLALRILDVERGTLSAPLTASGPLETLPWLLRGLAWDVALAGPAPPVGTRTEFLARATPPYPALRAYARSLAATDPVEQARLLREALKLASGFDEAWLALGRLQLDTRNEPAAVESLSRVAGSSRLAREARFLSGIALLELGRFGPAAELYAALVGEDPTTAALNNYALALLRAAPVPGPLASQLLRRAVDADPRRSEPRFNLGWALFCQGDDEAAAFWLRGVVRGDPSDAQARLALGWALRRSGRSADAEAERDAEPDRVFESEAPLTPDSGRRLERILRTESRPTAEAEERSGAELAAPRVGRAEKLVADGDWDGALAELTRAAYLDPYSAKAHRLLARVHRAQDRADAALAELRMALWCQEDAAVRVELATLLLELGRQSEARAEAGRVLAADPTNALAREIIKR